MAATHDDPPTFRCDSPPPDTAPSPALGGCPELSRCLSTASSVSHGSATTDASHLRESLGSDTSAISISSSAYSRASSGSFQSTSRRSDISFSLSNNHSVPSQRQSTGSYDAVVTSSGATVAGKSAASRRRGYMRPHGTDFAASARSRESVLSLGSIAHLQYYFARTGLLDGKGGQLARKRQLKAHTLDFSALDTSSFLNTGLVGSGSDHDSSYASMGSSPDQANVQGGFGGGNSALLVESPTDEHPPEHLHDDPEYYSDDMDDSDQMLPPTASTYNYREKPLPKPPSIAELKADLTQALDTAAQALKEARENKNSPSQPGTPAKTHLTPSEESTSSTPKSTNNNPGWHEIQGVHILDVMTLAIRAAKVYYTAHENPDRLDAIKSEKALRSELLSVMDVLKRMATRAFAGGLRDDESRTMEDWIAGLNQLLATEQTIEAAERAERESWTWLSPKGWDGDKGAYAREDAFIRSMLAGAPDPVVGMGPLPPWEPVDRTRTGPAAEAANALLLPTPFLAALSNGLRLVQLHNCCVRKSRRRFGAIPTFHTDTQKPYRAADNLRYWVKAAELRWEVHLKVDPLALQYNSGGAGAWLDFEDAVLQWCRKVREEIAGEVQV